MAIFPVKAHSGTTWGLQKADPTLAKTRTRTAQTEEGQFWWNFTLFHKT